MTQTHIGWYVTVGLFVALLSPFAIGAAERALTLASLEKAYEARVAWYDAEIASTTKALEANVVPLRGPVAKGAAEKERELHMHVTKMKNERVAVDAAYLLLVEAMK